MTRAEAAYRPRVVVPLSGKPVLSPRHCEEPTGRNDVEGAGHLLVRPWRLDGERHDSPHQRKHREQGRKRHQPRYPPCGGPCRDKSGCRSEASQRRDRGHNERHQHRQHQWHDDRRVARRQFSARTRSRKGCHDITLWNLVGRSRVAHRAFHLGRADRLNALPDVRRLRCAWRSIGFITAAAHRRQPKSAVQFGSCRNREPRARRTTCAPC